MLPLQQAAQYKRYRPEITPHYQLVERYYPELCNKKAYHEDRLMRFGNESAVAYALPNLAYNLIFR
jgi:hypothetical protein